MRCHEVRFLSNAWHDSELDAKTAFDIQQHLDGCAACRAYFDGERHVDARVDATLRVGRKDPALWQRIESQVTAAAKPARMKWQVAVLAAAACIMTAFAITLWPRQPLDLAQVAAVDHAKYLVGEMPAQFEDQPSDEQMVKTQGRLDRAAFALLPPAELYQTEGKRLCFLKGVPVAWMLGRHADKPVSLIVMRGQELDRFPDLQRRFTAGHRIACSEAKGFQFAARQVDGHVICAVADARREDLESLIAAVMPAN